jgi:hypothetical protein
MRRFGTTNRHCCQVASSWYVTDGLMGIRAACAGSCEYCHRQNYTNTYDGRLFFGSLCEGGVKGDRILESGLLSQREMVVVLANSGEEVSYTSSFVLYGTHSGAATGAVHGHLVRLADHHHDAPIGAEGQTLQQQANAT